MKQQRRVGRAENLSHAQQVRVTLRVVESNGDDFSAPKKKHGGGK